MQLLNGESDFKPGVLTTEDPHYTGIEMVWAAVGSASVILSFPPTKKDFPILPPLH